MFHVIFNVLFETFGEQSVFDHIRLFGLIGLQSPVLKMSIRDNYLQIPNETLDLWVNKSMQAQRLGAIPPYNQLLGGKMVAMALTASELRRAYKKKYKDTETLMQKRIIEPDFFFNSLAKKTLLFWSSANTIQVKVKSSNGLIIFNKSLLPV